MLCHILCLFQYNDLKQVSNNWTWSPIKVPLGMGTLHEEIKVKGSEFYALIFNNMTFKVGGRCRYLYMTEHIHVGSRGKGARTHNLLPNLKWGMSMSRYDGTYT